jgi:hypothetical protein
MRGGTGSAHYVVDIGGDSRDQLLERLRDGDVGLNAYAETLIGAIQWGQTELQTMCFATTTVGELGLSDGGCLSQVLAAAEEAGLGPCPLVSAPYLRLAIDDQPRSGDDCLSAGRPPDGAIHIASIPVSDDPAFPTGFYLRAVGDRKWLRGFRCDANYHFEREKQWIFVVPR